MLYIYIALYNLKKISHFLFIRSSEQLFDIGQILICHFFGNQSLWLKGAFFKIEIPSAH